MYWRMVSDMPCSPFASWNSDRDPSAVHSDWWMWEELPASP